MSCTRTSFESLAFVSAPFSNSSLTAGASAALIAKNSTGMGNEDAFGLAPRLKSSRTVASKCGRLEIKHIQYVCDIPHIFYEASENVCQYQNVTNIMLYLNKFELIYIGKL